MQLNKPCEIEEWQTPEMLATLRILEPDIFQLYPGYPAGREHRKSWEHHQILAGCKQLGCVHPDASVLVVSGGRERVIFELTNRARWVFAVDRFWNGPGQPGEMLLDPALCAAQTYNARRLVVQNMDPLVLRFEAESFDTVAAIGFSSHDAESARLAVFEVSRVLKPGGIAVLVYDMVVNGGEGLSLPGLRLYDPGAITALIADSGLELVENIQAAVSPATVATVRIYADVVQEVQRGYWHFPHILFEEQRRLFTSASVFLRKTR